MKSLIKSLFLTLLSTILIGLVGCNKDTEPNNMPYEAPYFIDKSPIKIAYPNCDEPGSIFFDQDSIIVWNTKGDANTYLLKTNFIVGCDSLINHFDWDNYFVSVYIVVDGIRTPKPRHWKRVVVNPQNRTITREAIMDQTGPDEVYFAHPRRYLGYKFNRRRI